MSLQLVIVVGPWQFWIESCNRIFISDAGQCKIKTLSKCNHGRPISPINMCQHCAKNILIDTSSKSISHHILLQIDAYLALSLWALILYLMLRIKIIFCWNKTVYFSSSNIPVKLDMKASHFLTLPFYLLSDINLASFYFIYHLEISVTTIICLLK